MRHSPTFDILSIVLPLAAAFALLIACSDTHPAPAAKKGASANQAAAAPATATPSPTPTAQAAGPVTKKPAMKVDLPADLLAQTKVPLIQALVTARAKVPGARPVSEELERENGKLIYTFDLVTPGTSGVTEVNVDALSGSVVAVQHESASAEKQEKRDEEGPEGKH